MSIIPYAFAAMGCLGAPDGPAAYVAGRGPVCPVPVAAVRICPDERPVLDDVAGLCLRGRPTSRIWGTLTRLAAVPVPPAADDRLTACLFDGNGVTGVARLPSVAVPVTAPSRTLAPSRPWPGGWGGDRPGLDLVSARAASPAPPDPDPLPEIVPIDAGIEGRPPVSAPILALGVGSTEQGRDAIEPPTVVPLPAPLWLLGAGLMLLAGMRRRLNYGV